jgi:branched-chain amino acid transport system ATP-binding protein
VTSDDVLVVSDLSRSFGGVHAVQKVSFGVPRGSLTGLIGPNGAGKTTTLNMISGLLTPSSGSVSLDGSPLLGLRPDEVARKGIARTFQTPQIAPALNVLENVMLGAACRNRRTGLLGETLGLPAARKRQHDIRDRSQHWLEFVGLKGFGQEAPDQLPFGRIRLLELARAAAAEPSLLLLDEPSSGLSTDEVAQFEALLSQLREAGTSVVLVEHNMRLVMRAATHVVVLDQGKKLAEGPPKVVKTDPAVQSAYLGTAAEV